MSSEKLAYNLKTASKKCGMSETVLYRAIKAGDLRAKRTSINSAGVPSGLIIILKAELDVFLENLPDDWWGHRY